MRPKMNNRTRMSSTVYANHAVIGGSNCPYDEIGRHEGLKILCLVISVQVQVLLWAQTNTNTIKG